MPSSSRCRTVASVANSQRRPRGPHFGAVGSAQSVRLPDQAQVFASYDAFDARPAQSGAGVVVLANFQTSRGRTMLPSADRWQSAEAPTSRLRSSLAATFSGSVQVCVAGPASAVAARTLAESFARARNAGTSAGQTGLVAAAAVLRCKWSVGTCKERLTA
jgi:hypothetical protein